MSRRALAPLAVSLLAATLAAVGSWFNWFAALDQAWYDLSVRAHTLDYPEDVAIVAIDESSLDALGAWPWDRRQHAKLLARLQGARAVVFDLLFAEAQSASRLRSGADITQDAGSADQDFADALRKHGRALLPVYIEQQEYRGLMQEILPTPLLANAAAAMGHAHVEYGRDGIARGVYLRMGLGKPYWPQLSLALAELSDQLTPAQGERWRGESERGSPYKIYAQHFVQLRFAGPPRTVYRFSYVDVLEGRVPANALQDKIVYVGATATGLGDDVPTPFGAMPGVELHANAFHALRSNGFINTLSPRNTALLHGLLALVTCLVLSRLAPRAFLLGTLFALLLFASAVTALFFMALQWFRPTPFFAALILFYPLWSWRRIEIAMGFLRRELAELQGEPAERAPSVEQMREQLDSLVELGVLQQAGIEPVVAVSSHARWPQYQSDAGRLQSAFALDGKFYRVELAATGSATQGRQLALATLACLVDELPTEEKPSDDSYELVERTIAEIYAARKVVERTRERMNESMARLQDVVVVSDIAGRIIFINDRGALYFEPDLGGQSVFTLHRFLGQPVWQAILRLLMVDGEQVYREVETGAGKLLLCQATRLVEADAFRDTLLFVFTDVTELRALEQGKNEALAFLSHDMRSPLVSQLALIENFRMEEGGAVGRERELLDKLVYFAERSLKYSEDFLQLARAENIDQNSFQLVDLHGVVDAALAEVAGLALQRGVRLEIVRTADDCWMLGDAQLLERAVSNLLSNAIQHSPQDEKVTVTLRNEERLAVCVADHGSGIDAEALPHLFKPYFRARRAAQHSGAGSASDQILPDTDASQASGRILSRNYGLGLSFVHSVVERHGGQIDVQSVPGAGTRITLYLPETELD